MLANITIEKSVDNADQWLEDMDAMVEMLTEEFEKLDPCAKHILVPYHQALTQLMGIAWTHDIESMKYIADLLHNMLGTMLGEA